MNQVEVTGLSKESLEYYKYLHSLSLRDLFKEVDVVFKDLRSPKLVYKKKNYSGIFYKTPNSIKCATGVRFGCSKEVNTDGEK